MILRDEDAILTQRRFLRFILIKIKWIDLEVEKHGYDRKKHDPQRNGH